ncbi:MAG TPA: POTRA domain-containing protein [Terriglobales bacterium]|nr:POTRA domain-containing protein [Terriglobales bacterium]
MRGGLLPAILSVLLLSTCVSLAQEIPTPANLLPSYEGQTVSTVELAGRPDLSPDQLAQLKSLVKQQQGKPFSMDDISASVSALKSSSLVQDVRLDVTPEANGVRVSFVLLPAYFIGVYEFPGALGHYSYSRLLQVANYPMEGPYSPIAIVNAQRALETHFRRGGFFEAQVTTTLDLDSTHHVVNVAFATDLNRRAKFGHLTIEGATPEEAVRLRNSLKGWIARFRRVAVQKGKSYSFHRLQSAEQYLQKKLAAQGYLAAQVKIGKASYTAESNHADVSFNIVPGPKIHVKAVGAHLWGRTLHRLVPVYQENLFNAEMVQEGRQNLLSYFQSKGYFDAQVHVHVNRQPSLIDVEYNIDRGKRHDVVSVAVHGNHALSTDSLMSNIVVKKKFFISMLDHGKYSDALVTTSLRNIRDAYKNAGFSEVSVTPKVNRPGGNIAVVFQIAEGPRDLVQSFDIEGNTLPESELAPKGLQIGPGKPYSGYLVNQDRNQIMAQYLTLGYLTATFEAKSEPVSKNSHEYRVVYHVHEGPQVKTARVVTIGRNQTKQQMVNTAVKIKPNTPLSEDQMLSAESRLYNLGIFDWAEIDPKQTVTDQSNPDVLIKLHEAKRNTITYGFGFEVINRGGSVPGGTVALPGIPPVGLPNSFRTSQKTFWGPRGLLEYTRKNMRGRAESWTFGGFAGRLDQRAYTNYNIPSFRGSSWSATSNAQFEHDSENPIFTARIARGGLEFRKALDAKKQKLLFLRYTVQRTDLTRLLIPALVPLSDQNVLLSTVSASYIRDTRDNALDAHKGIYQSYEVSLTPTALGSSVNFARALGQTAYYKNIGIDNIIWANSIRLGLEEPFSNSHVPLSEEFFTGGGSTLRGFPLNGAGPQRVIVACGNPGDPTTCSQIQVPTGGNQLFILNSEFRIPLPIKKGLGVVGFYDGGNVFAHVGFHDFLSNYSNNVGFGVRYATPVGPVRLDIGRNLNPIPGIKATQVFVTLGQAF